MGEGNIFSLFPSVGGTLFPGLDGGYPLPRSRGYPFPGPGGGGGMGGVGYPLHPGQIPGSGEGVCPTGTA